ncbi:hypothetical protein DYY88_18310 [Leptolyngbya iicbica LK]|uniref:Uncharacterized protein n=3 Tax=Cyanophyceae TaxID=3028117 RepID=A0A4V2E230_9CYAN|nr:hypothetical protein DYY88_18310 [Leptolyngbya sp. LK]
MLRPPEKLQARPAQSMQATWVWVLALFLLGLLLRVTNLDLKTAWMDEVSTVIFSLGNSSFLLPVDQLVDLDALLQPIRAQASATPIDSARFLLQENNHPPLYFMLAHLWMDLFSTDGVTASLPIARLFSAFWGAAAIPVIYWASRHTFQSRWAGIFSAALMAVSPFGIFLAQEARHYGLAITLISLSLGCFAIATRAILAGNAPSWRLCLGWILVNALGFANHYFSALSFTAESMVLAAIALHQWRHEGIAVLRCRGWRRIYTVALMTTVSILVWLPVLINFYGSPQTTFLKEEGASLMKFINPIAQSFAAMVTSFVTPANFFAQNPWQIAFIAGSILFTLAFIVMFVPAMARGTRLLNRRPTGHTGLAIMGGFGLAMLGLFALICYGQGSDITRGLRYMFTYYPALMILAGGIFATYWQGRSPADALSVATPFTQYRLSGRRFVQGVWVAGLLSALMVVNNLAFPKYYAPDRFIPFMQAHSSHPIAIASTEKIFAEPTVIGAKFLSLGWEIERSFHPDDAASGWTTPPVFFAIKQGDGVERPVTESFANLVSQFTEPTDLWVIRPEIDPADPLITAKPSICQLAADQPQGNKGGYLYLHFSCRNSAPALG